MPQFDRGVFGKVDGLKVRKQGSVDFAEGSPLQPRNRFDDDIAMGIADRIGEIERGEPVELVGAWLGWLRF